MPKVTVFICTRNRSQSLRQTLAAMRRVVVPSDLPTELLVVDNGSTDDTHAAVAAAVIPQMEIRYCVEPLRGKARACNRVIAESRGEILISTDDDIEPGPHWIESMACPIAAGTAEIVAGGVVLSPELRAIIKSDWCAGRLAARDLSGKPYHPTIVVGANMAFAARVTSKVPQYDVELGVGAMGSGEEGLFVLQLQAAGFRGAFADSRGTVEHHASLDRLTPENLVDDALKCGRSQAYIDYHWNHAEISLPRWQLLRLRLGLAYLRLRTNSQPGGDPISAAQWHQHFRIGYHSQWLVEKQRPRNYERHGLVKKSATPN